MTEKKGTFRFTLRNYICLFFIVLFSLTSCSANLLKEFAKTETNEAIFEDAKILVDKADWDNAITKFEELSAAFLAKREVLYWRASAYAGRCGLDFLALSTVVNERGTTKLLEALMAVLPDYTDPKLADCVAAEADMITIGAIAADRTTEENILLAYIAFTKIGLVLSEIADDDDDATVDLAFDPCLVNATNSQEIGISFHYALKSLEAIATETTVGNTEATELAGACAELDTADSNYNFCDTTSKASITGDKAEGVRTMINEKEYIGLSKCGTASLDTCLCP